jgi:transposase
MYLDEIRDILALESDVLVSITTLHRVLAAAGLTYKLLRRQALERDNIARFFWMQETQHLYRAN